MYAISQYNISNSRFKKTVLIQLYRLQREYNYDSKNLFLYSDNFIPQSQNELLSVIRTEKEEMFGLFP